MKQKVIEFFQNLPEEKTEQFNEAFSLYRQSSGKNASVERSYNASGYSPHVLENLLYDLQGLHGITDVEKVTIAMKVVEEYGLATNELPQYLVGMEYLELVEWVGKLDEKEFESWKRILQQAITEEEIYASNIILSEIEKIENIITEIPAEMFLFSEDELRLWAKEKGIEKLYQIEQVWALAVNSENDLISKVLSDEMNSIEYGVSKISESFELVPIREEFPFLNDVDCPDELKILVSDKISANKRYVIAKSLIDDVEAGKITMEEKALANIAKEATDAFSENQRIYDELNVYKETGKVLGVHPIFKKLQLSREVEVMTSAELIAYKGSSAKYFSDNKKGLAKAKQAKDEAKVSEIENRVAERKDKLFLVNKKLGV